MKIGTIPKLRRDDLAASAKGETVPDWTDGIIRVVNTALETFTRALKQGLDYSNNFDARESTLKLTSGTALEVAVPTGKRVKTVQILEVPGQTVTGWGFTRKSNGNISIVVTWSGGGSANVTYQLIFG